MGWERGYYYRARKVAGRVVREYVGAGRVAELPAQLDAIERQERQTKRAARQAEKTELAALDAGMKALAERVDLVARAALLAAGYHQHKRGEWRMRRGRDGGAG
jgi:hypothetical protein